MSVGQFVLNLAVNILGGLAVLGLVKAYKHRVVICERTAAVWRQARERTRRTIDLVAYRLATSPYVQLVIAAVAVGLALSIGHNGPDGLGRMMNALVGTAISIALLYAARRHVRKLRNRLPGVGRETSQLGMFGNLAAAIAH